MTNLKNALFASSDVPIKSKHIQLGHLYWIEAKRVIKYADGSRTAKQVQELAECSLDFVHYAAEMYGLKLKNIHVGNVKTMRKITKDAITAFLSFKPFRRDNTEVRLVPPHVRLYLHGHLIAHMDASGLLRVTNAGYFTNVTKERLNGLPGVSICQRKGVWYLDGEEWDGEWTTVSEEIIHGKAK